MTVMDFTLIEDRKERINKMYSTYQTIISDLKKLRLQVADEKIISDTEQNKMKTVENILTSCNNIIEIGEQISSLKQAKLDIREQAKNTVLAFSKNEISEIEFKELLRKKLEMS